MRALMLPVGEDRIAFPLDTVVEVVKVANLHALPTAPRQVLGLINLRGESLALLDTAVLLGIARQGRSEYAVVIELADGRIALAGSAAPTTVDVMERLDDSPLVGGLGTYQSSLGVVSLVDPHAVVDPMARQP